MLSGLIGAGAQDGLEELLVRQLKEQMAQEEIRQAKAREAFQREGLAFDKQRHADDMTARARDDERRERERRDRNNQFGVEQMGRDRQMLDTAEDRARAQFDRDALLAEIERLAPQLSPGRAAAARAAARGGQRIGPADLKTQADEEKERKDRIAEEIAIAEGRERAQQKYSERGMGGGSGSGKDAVANDYSQERETRVLQSIDELMGQINRSTTGIGSLLSRLPETDARSFKSQLDTLKSNIAFNELTQMRAASKTGGALGNVSNVELALLESALGALDPGQRPEQLKGQLQKVRGSIERWQRARAESGGRPASPARLVPSHSGGGKKGAFNPATGKIEWK